jgi:hypothetical protein
MVDSDLRRAIDAGFGQIRQSFFRLRRRPVKFWLNVGWVVPMIFAAVHSAQTPTAGKGKCLNRLLPKKT